MKKGFVLYKSYYAPLKHLTDEQMGRLFRAIFEYQNDGSEPSPEDPIFMAFGFIKNQFDLDNEKYEEFCEKQSEKGKKGGRPRKDSQNPDEEKAAAFSENPKNPELFLKPKKAYKDEDEDEDKDISPDGDNARGAEISLDAVIAAVTPIEIPNPVVRAIRQNTPTSIPWLVADVKNEGAAFAKAACGATGGKLKPPDVWLYLHLFAQERTLEKELVKPPNDFRKHFLNWLKIRILKNPITPQTNGTVKLNLDPR